MRFSALLHGLLFPPKCAGCGKRMPLSPEKPEPAAFCPDCTQRLERAMRAQCPECFCAYADCRCTGTHLKKAGCSALVKLAAYNAPDAHALRNTVLYLKDHRIARTFAQLAHWLQPGLAKAMEKSGYTKEDAVIVYLPRSKRAARRAGTDQAKELACALSVESGIACEAHLVRRHHTKQQKRLTQAQRRRNLANSFEVVGSVSGRVVILVDDVVTTGATMCAGSKLLRAVGATDVIGVCIARTEKLCRKAHG